MENKVLHRPPGRKVEYSNMLPVNNDIPGYLSLVFIAFLTMDVTKTHGISQASRDHLGLDFALRVYDPRIDM